MDAATHLEIVNLLDRCVEQGMRSLLDVGCGGVNAAAACSAVTSGPLRYFGVDSSATLISHHRRVFPWFLGRVVDFEADPRLMRADVILAHGVLERFCNGTAGTLLHYMSFGKWRWLIVSSKPGADNGSRRGLRSGLRSLPLDVASMGILKDAPVSTLPDGSLVFHRDPPPTGERFLILCRERNPQAETLCRQLSAFGEAVIIEDTAPPVPGYYGITNLGKPTAWDRVFHGIDPTKPAWLIEDDVACRDWRPIVTAGAAASVDLVAMSIATREDAPDWPWWPRDAALQRMAKSFNPVCRLSAALIARILAYRQERGAFSFHEFLFPSLADTTFDLRRHLPGSIGTFRWRPEITGTPDTRLQHPVKDPATHRAISG